MGPTAFLAWLKLSVYMAIVSVAIVLSFHLKSEPSPLGKWIQFFFGMRPYTYVTCRTALRITVRNPLLVLGFGMHGGGLV